MRFERKEDKYELERLFPSVEWKIHIRKKRCLIKLAEWLECHSFPCLMIIFSIPVICLLIHWREKCLDLAVGFRLLIFVAAFFFCFIIPLFLIFFVCAPLGQKTRDKIFELYLKKIR